MSVVVEGTPRRGLRFEVVDDAGWTAAIRKILQALEEDLGAVVRIEGEEQPEAAGPVCGVCGARAEIETHGLLGVDACPTCWQVADRLLARFQDDFRKHQREFHGQLAQMVKDVRAGAEEPSFYRGFE